MGNCFFSIFNNSRKNNGDQAFSVTFASRLHNSCNPLPRASTCGKVRAPDPTPSAPKCGSRMFMLRVKPCHSEMLTVALSPPGATRTATDSETALALTSDPPKLCRSAAPRARLSTLQSKPSIVFSNSLRE